MPTISKFFGMKIMMYWNDHAPPHFHVIYGDLRASVDIEALKVLEGNLSRRAQGLVLEWAEMHQDELMEDWELCSNKQMPNKIEPLG